MKKILKFTALSAFLLVLAGLMISCNNETEGQYKAFCATLSRLYDHRDCWTITFESNEPIGGLSSPDGLFSFFVDNLPNGFKNLNGGTPVTISFNLTNEIRQCGFGEARVVEIVTIKNCNQH